MRNDVRAILLTACLNALTAVGMLIAEEIAKDGHASPELVKELNRLCKRFCKLSGDENG